MNNPISKFRTICEVLREMNDICQGTSKNDLMLREKIAEAEKMGKSMSNKLIWYNKEFIKEEFE